MAVADREAAQSLWQEPTGEAQALRISEQGSFLILRNHTVLLLALSSLTTAHEVILHLELPS